MTETSAARKVSLALAGLLLGVLIYLFYLVGGVLTLAGFLVERATVPLSRAQFEPMIRPVEQELLSVVEDVAIGGRTTVSEESVNRLLAASLSNRETSGQFDGYSLGSVKIDLEPARIIASTTLSLTRGIPLGARVGLRPISTSLAASFHGVPGEDGVLLTLTGLKIGALSLPMRTLDSALKQLDPSLISESGLPFRWISARSVSLPYRYLDGKLPQALSLDGLEIRQDQLVARLSVDSRLEERLINEIEPLLEEQGTALQQAVAAAFPDSRGVLKERAATLAALGTPETGIPTEPSALVGYIENEVWAELPGSERIVPEIGGDLVSGTVITTGEASLIELVLRDTSVLKIGENTRFALKILPGRSGTSRSARGDFALFAGAVRARVAKSFAPNYRFETPSAVCGVRGTDLILELGKQGRFGLSVLEGSVALVPAAGVESLVKTDEQVSVKTGLLKRKSTTPLAPTTIDNEERRRLETEMAIRTSGNDEPAIRRSAQFWSTIDALKGFITGVMAMEEEDRERLGRELEKRIDPAAVDARFRALMRNADFAAFIESTGIEGIPYL